MDEDEKYFPPEPVDRGPPPDGTKLVDDPVVGELLIAARGFDPGELVVREEVLLLAPPELPPMGMFRPVPENVGAVKMDGEGFPHTVTFNRLHFNLLFAFINEDRTVQAESLRMQSDMTPGSECVRSIEEVAKYLWEQQLPWLNGMEMDVIFKLLRLFRVNSFPCKSGGRDRCCLLKWGTMLNTTCRPNCHYMSAEVDGKYEGRFYALRFIKEGEILGSSYAPHTSLVGSLVQRRRVFWNLKGFECKCPWCCEEEVHGDPGNLDFIGTECGMVATTAEKEREVQLCGEVMCLVMQKPFWERLELIEPLRDRVSELPTNHWARRAVQCILLLAEGKNLQKRRGPKNEHGALLVDEASIWLHNVWEINCWVRSKRPELHVMTAFQLAPLVNELSVGIDASEDWMQEVVSWALAETAIDEAAAQATIDTNVPLCYVRPPEVDDE